MNYYSATGKSMSFKSDCKFGKLGEDVFEADIKEVCRSGTLSYENTSNNPNYYQADVDFLLFENANACIPVEIKSDQRTWATGNIIWEETDTTRGGIKRDGCFRRTKSKFIMYYVFEPDVNGAHIHTDEKGFVYKYRLHSLYIIDTLRYRAYVDKEYVAKKKTLRNMGNGAYGYLVPAKDLISNGIAIKAANAYKCDELLSACCDTKVAA